MASKKALRPLALSHCRNNGKVVRVEERVGHVRKKCLHILKICTEQCVTRQQQATAADRS